MNSGTSYSAKIPVINLWSNRKMLKVSYRAVWPTMNKYTCLANGGTVTVRTLSIIRVYLEKSCQLPQSSTPALLPCVPFYAAVVRQGNQTSSSLQFILYPNW